MSRAGRKRATLSAREPSGRIERRNTEDVRAVVLRQPHRSTVAPEKRHDQLAECELGRLLLAEKITRPQYDAGVMWRDLSARFRSAINAPRLTPASIAATMIPVPPDVTGGTDWSVEAAERVERQYFDAHTALYCRTTREMAEGIVVDYVVVQERNMSEVRWQVGQLRRGLARLATHWGLTNNRNCEMSEIEAGNCE